MEVVNLGPLLSNELAAPSPWQHSPPSGPILLEAGLCAWRGDHAPVCRSLWERQEWALARGCAGHPGEPRRVCRKPISLKGCCMGSLCWWWAWGGQVWVWCQQRALPISTPIASLPRMHCSVRGDRAGGLTHPPREHVPRAGGAGAGAAPAFLPVSPAAPRAVSPAAHALTLLTCTGQPPAPGQRGLAPPPFPGVRPRFTLQ